MNSPPYTSTQVDEKFAAKSRSLILERLFPRCQEPHRSIGYRHKQYSDLGWTRHRTYEIAQPSGYVVAECTLDIATAFRSFF
jgi:hypothetical protein